MTTLFYLLRHAEHGHVGKVLTGRLAGAALSEAGRKQARDLARRMAAVRLDALFASPRLRARQTAGFISHATGREVQISTALDEIDFGRWSGRTFEELEADPDWKRWNAERDTARTPAGESMSGVAARLWRFINRLHEDHPGGSFCLVSHSDVIKAGVCRSLGRAFRDVHEFDIAPASVTTFAVDDGGRTVLALNRHGPAELREPAL